ncbi:membrane metallo-endopeptidase-like 1 [Dermacentor albipictus]|uniref:membrane metallo-endopeptidase-like 1 n=1 Tax=Dermacentor albipictus TaxID=60249 RepID=UPI0031FCB3BC
MAGGDAPSPAVKTEMQSGSSIGSYLIVVLGLVLIGVLIFLLIYGEHIQMSIRKSEKHRRCEAADCEYVKKMMHLGPVSGDLPCRDFYSYVCSPWASANIKGVNVSWLGSQKYVDDLQADMKKREPNNTYQTVLDMVLITYRSCLLSVTGALATEIKPVFEKFHLGNWPHFTLSDSESYDVFRELIRLDMKWGMKVVFVFENALFGEGTLRRRLSIRATPFACPFSPDSNKSLENYYEEYVKEVFALFSYYDDAAAQELAGIHLSICRASKAMQGVQKSHTLQEIAAVTRDMGLSEKDWSEALEPMGAITSTTRFQAKLYYVGEAVRSLIKDLPPESAMRFFGFSILTQMAGHQEELRKVMDKYFSFNHPVAHSPVQIETCVSFIFTHFMESWNLYVLSVASTNRESSKDVRQLVDSIKSSMTRRIRSSLWMDELSKSRTLEKLKRTKVVAPEIGSYLKTFNLSERYANLDALSPTDYYGNQLKIRANNAQYNVRGIKRSLGERNVALAGGDANPITNMVHVYAGLRRLPFYSAEVPLAIKYGGLGSATGRLLALLFTGKSVKKDVLGSTAHWWTGGVYQEYKKRAMCFAQQANPNAPLGEEADFLADYLGARVALDALLYAMAGRKTRLTIGGIGLSDEQLFFITYCHVMCASVDFEGKLMLPESALKRCNGAVMNMPEFGKAFRCNHTDVDKDAILNPTHKCSLY